MNDAQNPAISHANRSGSTLLNGAPAVSDRTSLTLGPDGPLLLHDHALVTSLAHFNRENIPDRKPHAKGSGAFGELIVTHDVSRYTKAALFQPGTRTRMLARFSTVAGEAGSPDTWRDVRGFALKFYTSEGNWDLVGNNTPVFFVRDPMKFPHFIRSQKRLPHSGLRDQNMQWDFWTMNPETSHQVTYLMGDRGLPRSWRYMNGYGSHTYMWTNAEGERFWVKFHFHSDQGVENWAGSDAEKIAGEDADFHRRDLFDAIEKGDLPSWTLSVQVMPYEEAKTYRFNPFDLTKIWSHQDYPLIEVGRMTLDRNPENFFAQVDQASFAPSNIVPGIGFSPDRMLLARVFAYADAHRARLGVNHDQLPVNQPLPEVMEKRNVYTFDGPMRYHHSGSQATYAANSTGRPYSDVEGPVEDRWEADGEMVHCAQTLRIEDDDFGQAGTLVRDVFDDAQRDRFVQTVAGTLLQGVSRPVLERAFWYWSQVDTQIGARIKAEVERGQTGQ
ncbi:catalase [Austwickia chelonae]|uniref:catalase n=1 Tax=Austwickia chelonae TaxID=100225 RepID=UPI000E24EFF2|nr:catalase [Austwickia chelonae]